jgi:hypothetical protein
MHTELVYGENEFQLIHGEKRLEEKFGKGITTVKLL